MTNRDYKKDVADATNTRNRDDMLLNEIIGHNVFFDKIVLHLGIQSRQEDMVTVEKNDKNVTKFKKKQNLDHKEAKRARHKQDKSADMSNKKRKFSNENENKDSLTSLADSEIQIEEEKNESDNNTGEIRNYKVPKEGAALSVNELREKFKAKLESVKRKNSSKSSDENPEKKDKRVKRKEKNKKQSKKGNNNKTDKTEKEKLVIKEKSEKDPNLPSIPAPADDIANLDFGKIDGLNPTSYYYQDNKALANTQGGKKHLIHQLQDAEKKQSRVRELLASGDETRKEKAQKMLWTDTFKVASGERVTNDPAKLKKKIKQKLKKKEQSAKAWNARLETQENSKKERQRIRTHNLQKRKMGGSVGANLSKKRIKDDGDDD